MKGGMLYIKEIASKGMPFERTFRELYLPILHADRAVAYSILTDAMEQWKLRERKDSSDPKWDFYLIADALGKERLNGSLIFIGIESEWYDSLEQALKDRSFVFTVDFENEKIVTLK
jgi:hypothetical protein